MPRLPQEVIDAFWADKAERGTYVPDIPSGLNETKASLDACAKEIKELSERRTHLAEAPVERRWVNFLLICAMAREAFWGAKYYALLA